MKIQKLLDEVHGVWKLFEKSEDIKHLQLIIVMLQIFYRCLSSTKQEKLSDIVGYIDKFRLRVDDFRDDLRYNWQKYSDDDYEEKFDGFGEDFFKVKAGIPDWNEIDWLNYTSE